MERTLVILKPGCLQRGLVGEVISRFEKRGLKLVAMKMVQLTDEILDVHYAHLKEKPFFPWLRDGMKAAPVILCCWEGYSAVQVVRDMAGATRASKAVPGTIRGDFSMSAQENIVHTSDSLENAAIELDRFFVESDYCDYISPLDSYKYAPDEM
ncbi:MAG: nucleoside-diphosphate kinase [Bacteroidales bacterium]|nr:nucleoside-diphosphate kinase [Bacteroidales bacterium]